MAAVDVEYVKDIEKARRDLRALIYSNTCAPLMLRLAWHDAGTYDAKTKTGGPNGSIRNETEYKHSANAGLKTAIDLCESVKTRHPKITYADLFQLAGIVAVEITGGPSIDFVPGRKDSLESPEEGRLPDAKQGQSHLRDVFYRMGLSDKDIVALSGGHTLGKAHRERSSFDGAWTDNPWKFDNSYFVELLKRGDSSQGGRLLKLHTDKALVQDPKFCNFVKLYANDEDVFFNDYAESHKKLSELGFTAPPPALKSSKKVLLRNGKTNKRRVAGRVVFSIAVAVVILSYIYQLAMYQWKARRQ
ncbi:unnamed protein product [Cuscuta europaea]|uniref:Plant heme peroxidase family profile domain-containing protein n=1 Tax=Cuscuta europaea TaxID=41803 RepID=A0A9P0YKV2_CUSEU|nr:unnamed protein product [Cuscuta europaea]